MKRQLSSPLFTSNSIGETKPDLWCCADELFTATVNKVETDYKHRWDVAHSVSDFAVVALLVFRNILCLVLVRI